MDCPDTPNHSFLNSSRPLASVLVQIEILSCEQWNVAHPSKQVFVSAHFKPSDVAAGLTFFNGDFTLVPTHDIGPLFARVLFANLAPLFTIRFAIADDSNGRVVVLVTHSDPCNAVG